MYNSEHLQEKWQPVLNHPDLPEISDSYNVQLPLLSWKTKNSELKEQRQMLMESDMQTDGSLSPIGTQFLSHSFAVQCQVSLHDVCGVQPMSGPTGLIFAMKNENRMVELQECR